MTDPHFYFIYFLFSRLSRVSAADEDTYICEAVNVVGTARANATLTVYSEYNRPEINHDCLFSNSKMMVVASLYFDETHHKKYQTNNYFGVILLLIVMK